MSMDMDDLIFVSFYIFVLIKVLFFNIGNVYDTKKTAQYLQMLYKTITI